MPIKRINEFPEGSGSLSNDDVFLFMDDPSGSGITKKISLSEISTAIGGGGGNSFDQSLNTFDSPAFSQLSISGSQTYYVMGNIDGNVVTSLNGLNWNGPFDINISISHIATNGNVIVIINNNTIGYTLFSNPSSVSTITPTIEGLTNIVMSQVIYGGDYFIISGEGNDGSKSVPIYGYSTDGSNWTFKTVTGILASLLANGENNENCTFSDVDYNGTGWNFAVLANNVGGGVYTTDITDTFTDTNYFMMVPGLQVAWNGNAWYYINSEYGSGFNTNTDPRLGEWIGPFNPWASSKEDLGINIESSISDTFCGGNGYLAFSDSNGHVSFSSDNGSSWTYVTPIPYSATITGISYIDNKYQLSLSGITSHDNGEKIIISYSSVPEYNGTYYLDNENFLYSDYQLNTPWIPEVDPFVGTATLTWSHGQYIDAMDYVNGYFYIGNDDEQIARSSNLTNWFVVDDRNNVFEYWNDFSGYVGTDNVNPLVINNNQISFSNGTTIAQGTFDNSTGGNGGISLNCYVGYELNWQGGHLRNIGINDQTATPQNIYMDSPIVFPGSGIAYMTVNSQGLTFPDGSTQTSAGGSNSSVVQLGSVSGTINTDASLGNIFDLTLAASGTLVNPTNPSDGQSCRWRITFGGSGIPLTLGSDFRIPASASTPLPFSSASGVTDLLAATYDSSRSKWDVIAFVPGY